MDNSITDIEGILVGHASDLKAVTGCTVVRFEKKTVGGGFIPGLATGTRGPIFSARSICATRFMPISSAEGAPLVSTPPAG